MFTNTCSRAQTDGPNVVLWTHPKVHNRKCGISHPFIVGVFAKRLLTLPWSPQLPLLPWFSLGTRWRSWLSHYATSRKVAGWITDGANGIFY
jgi:hypothetical protein